MPEPRVSVILPVRDGGVWLRQAVDSILAQSLTELELLVVDDHSSDGATQALAGLAGCDRRLRLLPNPGRGLVDALNHGFGQARGPMLARMDADDLALPLRLATQVDYLAQHPEVAICATRVRIDGPLAQGGNQRYETWLNALIEPDAIARELFVESPLPHPTVMLRRSAWDALPGYQDGPDPEDYGLWLEAARRGMRFGKPAPVLLHWRDHAGRLTRTDARYGRARFLALKVRHLLDWRGSGRPLWIWGAGPGGRALHDALIAAGGRPQVFVDVHPRRIGGLKRGLPVRPLQAVLERPPGTLVLVAVGSAGARADIRQWCGQHGLREGADYLFLA
jgi:glycosyltransferase involved in cell wall biosynthesis